MQASNVSAGEILSALHANHEVEVLALVDNRVQPVGRFRLSVPAGLEDDIIAELLPSGFVSVV